jgi:hypothetical protein|tara:strand:- start:1366 stop:1662 length:297 start_codon:yes stop_codon:yes gene_type:complete
MTFKITTMRAVELAPAEGVLRDVSRQTPTPVFNEVLVQIVAAAVNFREIIVCRTGATVSNLSCLAFGSPKLRALHLNGLTIDRAIALDGPFYLSADGT